MVKSLEYTTCVFCMCQRDENESKKENKSEIKLIKGRAEGKKAQTKQSNGKKKKKKKTKK